MNKENIEYDKRYEIGPNNKGLIRVLTATSITSLGVLFSVEPGTWSTGQTEMFANFKDKDFWNALKLHKEKIVHKRDIVWYKWPDGSIYSTMCEVNGSISSLVTELSRTTVEYTEEK